MKLVPALHRLQVVTAGMRGKLRSEEHQLPGGSAPKPPGSLIFFILAGAGSSRLLSLELRWEKRPIFHSPGRERHKAVAGLSVITVLFATGQATQLTVPGGSYFHVLLFFPKGWPPCCCISRFGAFLGGRSRWLSISLCSSAVHTVLVFQSKSL